MFSRCLTYFLWFASHLIFHSQRVQFGSRIDGYGAIQEKIAKMSMIHYATESMAYMVAGTMDAGHQDYHVRS